MRRATEQRALLNHWLLLDVHPEFMRSHQRPSDWRMFFSHHSPPLSIQMPRCIYNKILLLLSRSCRTIGSLEFLPICPPKPVVSIAAMSILIKASTWTLWRQGYSSETLEAARQRGRTSADSRGVKAIVWRKIEAERGSIISSQVNEMTKSAQCQWVFSLV